MQPLVGHPHFAPHEKGHNFVLTMSNYMKASVYSNKLLIGMTNFKNHFGSMGHIWGDFYPTKEYEAIKPTVQAYCSSGAENFSDWLALRFSVQLENGYFIFPVGGFEIYDFPEFPNEQMEIHLAGIHSHIYFDYFNNAKPFLLNPWMKITIEEKIELEDRLQTSLGHHETSFAALTKNETNKEVLFSIHGRNPYTFAVIDFNDNVNLYSNNCYSDFDDFIEKHMMPDNLKT